MRQSIFAIAAALFAALIAMPAAAQDTEPSVVDLWAQSAHASAEAEAFTHWNDEGEIPPVCAFCHAGAGFRDFWGLDGSAAGEMSGPQPTGGVIDCDTCHADGAAEIASVTFPSGVVLQAPERNGTCYTCHQGRQSGIGVAQLLEGKEDDIVDPELSFANPHYLPAAATLNGAEAHGLYEYPGATYAGPFTHVPTADTCTDCHNPHSLEVAAADCASCHQTDDVRAIRMASVDHDGDGDTAEGIAGEVETLRETLAAAIATYAADTAGTAIAYDPHSYPYFFADLNGNGTADPDEATRANGYKAWTPRLMRAAYNYQYASKDPGAFAHNPDYVMQALIDSIADLDPTAAEGLTRPE